MNETANATLALGALPVMAHAREEVEEMAAIAAALVRAAAQELGTVVAVTGAVDQVSDGERTLGVANGDPLLARITGSGCIATAITGSFLAVRPDAPLAAAAEALVALGVAGEDAAREAKGPGSFHAALYDALDGLDPQTLDERARLT